jgi:hypothetical protein
MTAPTRPSVPVRGPSVGRRVPEPRAHGRDFGQAVAGSDLVLFLPVRRGEAQGGKEPFKPLRRVIESVNHSQGSA